MTFAKKSEGEISDTGSLSNHKTDTKVERDLRGLVEIAAQICDTPIAFVHFFDEQLQWIKARKGIDDTGALESLFQRQKDSNSTLLIIPDANDQLCQRPFSQSDLKLKFYAGVSLVTDVGHKLGVLGLIDQKPRLLNEKQMEDLRILADQMVSLLDLRLRNLQLQNLIYNKTTEISSLFDRIGDAFISLDKDWNYLYANKQLGEMIHRDPSTLIGKNVWQEFPQAINSATYHAFHKAMKEQKYVCHIDYYKPLNLWQENHIYPSPDGLSVFIRDISEQKHAEMKLIENIETLQRAEEQAKMGSWQVDVVSGARHWSKQLFLMFGFNPSGGIPTDDEMLTRIHPEDRPAFLASMDKIAQGIDPGDGVLRTNPLVLPLKYILGYTRQIKDDTGRIVRFEGTMIDVTELQKTNHELDYFVYSVSHDLRSPLSTILGLLNVAEMEEPESKIIPHVRMVRDQVNRLDYFIRDILDYFSNARSESPFEKIDFQKLIEETKNNLKSPTQTWPVQINLDISGDFEFFSDRSRLEIIFKNLISNSIKYQDFNKESCVITIKIEMTSKQAKVTYSDNGIGIEKSHLPKIFNMFYRASANSKGSGLGLYIVREAIYKLGGSIKVNSELGAYTVFDMVIPNPNFQKT